MHFKKVGNRYQVSRITGAHFNFLGLEFSTEDAGRPSTVDLREPSRRGSMDPGEVLANVLLGLEQALQQTGREWHPQTVFYYSEDTPPLTIYRELALELAVRVSEGVPFEE